MRGEKEQGQQTKSAHEKDEKEKRKRLHEQTLADVVVGDS